MTKLKGPGSMAHLCKCNHTKKMHKNVDGGCIATVQRTGKVCPCAEFRGRGAQKSLELGLNYGRPGPLAPAVKTPTFLKVLQRAARNFAGPNPRLDRFRHLLVNNLEVNGPMGVIVDVINDAEVDVIVPAGFQGKKEFRITIRLEETTDRFPAA